jgi:hypothetical protein
VLVEGKQRGGGGRRRRKGWFLPVGAVIVRDTAPLTNPAARIIAGVVPGGGEERGKTPAWVSSNSRAVREGRRTDASKN